MKPSEPVIYDVAGGIATLTMNRPHNRNALSAELINGLGDRLQEAAADADVRFIVLTHTGSTFCAGADLKGDGSGERPRYNLPEILNIMQNGDKPVIGKISGHCMGGGVGLAAACDLSIAMEDIAIGFTEVRIGVAPAIISVVCLPKMREGDAMDLFLSGEKISGIRAAEVGLVNKAVPRADYERACDGLIGKLARGGPLALMACKSLVRRVSAMERNAAFEWTAKLSADLFQSEEAAEGIAAFREKRPAAWVED